MEISNISCHYQMMGLYFTCPTFRLVCCFLQCSLTERKRKVFSRHGLTCGMLLQFTSPITSFTQYLYFARWTIQLFVPPPTAELFCPAPATPCYRLWTIAERRRPSSSRWGVRPPRVTPAYCPPCGPTHPSAADRRGSSSRFQSSPPLPQSRGLERGHPGCPTQPM